MKKFISKLLLVTIFIFGSVAIFSSFSNKVDAKKKKHFDKTVSPPADPCVGTTGSVCYLSEE